MVIHQIITNSPTDKELFLRLKYFSPFDIKRIPESILISAYQECLGLDIANATLKEGIHFTLPQLVQLFCDPQELQRGIMRMLKVYEE